MVPDAFDFYRRGVKRYYNAQASSAKVKHFRDDAFNMAVRGLVGCTSVIVVSRKGAWVSHLWEGPTFEQEERFTGIDVLVGMFNAIDSEFPGLNNFGFHGRMFDPITETDGMENIIEVIIHTPQRQWHIPLDQWPPGAVGVNYPPDENPKEDPGARGPWAEFVWDNNPDGPRYSNQIEELQTALEFAFPNSGINLNVYPLVDLPEDLATFMEYRDNLLRTTAVGKVLVQYDPFFSCNPQMAGVRVWVDGMTDPIYTDKWVPFNHQKPLLGSNTNLQRVFLTNRDTWNSTEEVCIMSNITTSSTTTSKAASTTLPPITSCSPLNGAMPGNAKQTQCACNDDLIAMLSSSKKSEGVTSYWCAAGNATVSVNNPTATLPPITSCSPLGGAMPGNPDKTQCACNDGLIAMLRSSTKSDGATSYWCGAGTATVSVDKPTPNAAGASAIAGILGGLKPTSKPTPSGVTITVLSTVLASTTVTPESKTSTTTVQPPPPAKPTRRFISGKCHIHLTRRIAKKQWPRGPDVELSYRVYDGSGELKAANDDHGQFDTQFIIWAKDTGLDDNILYQMGQKNGACLSFNDVVDHWDVLCQYQNFWYGFDNHWRLPDREHKPIDPLDIIADPLGDTVESIRFPGLPYCDVGGWDEDPDPHTQDMDCYFEC